MKFRPCIDLHSGKVKQIVGSTLTDDERAETKQQDQVQIPKKPKEEDEEEEALATNFETNRPAADYAKMYERDALTGGHVIMLGPGNTEAAKSALQAYPNGLQVGGGMNETNAQEWLSYGASHVIVTSYVFHHGQIDMERLTNLVNLIGKDKLVLDLSCRRKPNDTNPTKPYYVVTDRWQTYTNVEVNEETLQQLSSYCDEFLVHGVENEGKRCGILEDLVILLGKYSPIPVTYAGGVQGMNDLEMVKTLGDGKVDLTIGSALDCFGGDMSYDEVVAWHKKENSG
mmetsp:Transcript_12304/g.17992  ORF Transcript_12304/g.17992 Transcript_12304/m.17992 type:complete len:285 (-) Transcript_12304:391-1245(-)